MKNNKTRKGFGYKVVSAFHRIFNVAFSKDESLKRFSKKDSLKIQAFCSSFTAVIVSLIMVIMNSLTKYSIYTVIRIWFALLSYDVGWWAESDNVQLYFKYDALRANLISSDFIPGIVSGLNYYVQAFIVCAWLMAVLGLIVMFGECLLHLVRSIARLIKINIDQKKALCWLREKNIGLKTVRCFLDYKQ